jgi:hypothetical protein
MLKLQLAFCRAPISIAASAEMLTRYQSRFGTDFTDQFAETARTAPAKRL